MYTGLSFETALLVHLLLDSPCRQRNIENSDAIHIAKEVRSEHFRWNDPVL